MRVCLFEDHGVADLEPLTHSRPVFELLCGCTSLADKHRRYFAASDWAVLVRPGLAAVTRETSAVAVNDPAWLRAGPAVMVNGRWLPPRPLPGRRRSALRRSGRRRGCLRGRAD